uniref:Peptidase M24 domain-containing protein n=1 Tax=Trypanosoma congolense (strain IL3000) TaxID=1068625 RepID=G0V049_TRYCI|nr:conserved hypothetical protein [Trypanosoma congolense IL3000]
MGRGYSNSRSRSARPTLGMKRNRSMSLQKQLTTAVKTSGVTRDGKAFESAKPTARSSVRKSVDKSPAADSRSKTLSRGRSASTIRQRVADMERELSDQLEGEEKKNETINNPDVMTKYKFAGRAVDEVMGLVAAACVPGADCSKLCQLGDTELLQRIGEVFKKRDENKNLRPRGLSYPTNISVNQILCNYAPLDDSPSTILRGGDVVKIHMGCHLDGYPVCAARTIIVPFDFSVSSKGDIEGDTAVTSSRDFAAKRGATPHSAPGTTFRSLTQGGSNAIEAARVALHGIIHLMQPGSVNRDITDFIHRVGNYYGVQALEGVLSNRTKRWVPDGMDCIITRRVVAEAPHQDVADCTVDSNQVWTLDVAFTDHESYKVRADDDAPTTLFRRTEVDVSTDFRLTSVNSTLKEITEKHHCFPFNLRYMSSVPKARLALSVLRNNSIVDPLPVLRIKGERHITARFSATVAVSRKRITVLCGMPPQEPLVVPDNRQPAPIPDDIALVLSKPLEFGQDDQPARKKAKTEAVQRK